VERENSVLEMEAIGIHEETISEDLKLDKIETSKETSVNIAENETEDIIADSTGIVTVNYKKTPKGYTKTYTGVRSIKVSNEKSSTNKAIVSDTKTETETSKNVQNKNESLIKINQETKARKTNVEIKSTSTWFWLLFIIFLLVAWRLGLFSKWFHR